MSVNFKGVYSGDQESGQILLCHKHKLVVFERQRDIIRSRVTLSIACLLQYILATALCTHKPYSLELRNYGWLSICSHYRITEDKKFLCHMIVDLQNLSKEEPYLSYPYIFFSSFSSNCHSYYLWIDHLHYLHFYKFENSSQAICF